MWRRPWAPSGLPHGGKAPDIRRRRVQTGEFLHRHRVIPALALHTGNGGGESEFRGGIADRGTEPTGLFAPQRQEARSTSSQASSRRFISGPPSE